MEDFVKRILEEKKELDIKITKLDDFVNSDKSSKVKASDKFLLHKQLSIMIDYSNVLDQRLLKLNCFS